MSLNKFNLKKFQLHISENSSQKLEYEEQTLNYFKQMKDFENNLNKLSKQFSRLEKSLKSLKNQQWMIELSNKMKSLIEKVQKPSDCSSARWHYCQVENACGAGCMIHQLAYCFLVGLADQRISFIGNGWKYLQGCKNKEWECIFEPLTNCSIPYDKINSATLWKNGSDSFITTITRFNRKSKNGFFPWAATDGSHTNTPFWIFPELETFRKIHSDIRVFVVSHIEQYILQLNPERKQLIENILKSLETPYVGIHVRRTDHYTEARFRDLSEYLEVADKWFTTQELEGQERRIYLATDEIKVIEEAFTKYNTNYSWHISKYEGLKSGTSLDRYSQLGTILLFADWWALKSADYLVGTSSSQVTRLAYELSQAAHPGLDFTNNFYSLDDPWYFP